MPPNKAAVFSLKDVTTGKKAISTIEFSMKFGPHHGQSDDCLRSKLAHEVGETLNSHLGASWTANKEAALPRSTIVFCGKRNQNGPPPPSFVVMTMDIYAKSVEALFDKLPISDGTIKSPTGAALGVKWLGREVEQRFVIRNVPRDTSVDALKRCLESLRGVKVPFLGRALYYDSPHLANPTTFIGVFKGKHSSFPPHILLNSGPHTSVQARLRIQLIPTPAPAPPAAKTAAAAATAPATASASKPSGSRSADFARPPFPVVAARTIHQYEEDCTAISASLVAPVISKLLLEEAALLDAECQRLAASITSTAISKALAVEAATAAAISQQSRAQVTAAAAAKDMAPARAAPSAKKKTAATKAAKKTAVTRAAAARGRPQESGGDAASIHFQIVPANKRPRDARSTSPTTGLPRKTAMVVAGMTDVTVANPFDVLRDEDATDMEVVDVLDPGGTAPTLGAGAAQNAAQQ